MLLSRGGFFAFTLSISLMGGSSQAAEPFWTNAITEASLLGLDITKETGTFIGLPLKGIGPLGTVLGVIKAVPDARDRMEKYGLTGRQAFWEQAAIKGPSILAGFTIAAALAGCGATVVCGVVAIGGAVLVPMAMEISTEQLLNASHEAEQRALQQQKDQLQAQRNTNQWQDQRNAQIAQQRVATAPTTNPQLGSSPNRGASVQLPGLPSSIVTPVPGAAPGKSDSKSDDWLRTIMNNPKETPAARAIAAIALGKDPSVFVANTPSSRSQTPTTGAPPGSGKSDDWLRAIMNNPKETPAARAIAAIALGKDPSVLVANTPLSRPQAPATGATPTPQPAVRLPATASAPAPSGGPPSISRQTTAPVRSTSPGQVIPTAAIYRPGGILLSKAAAERMALDIDLEGLHYRNGQIVLSGRASAGTSIDAALFLTALRTACEVGDPFFSLDPDNGQAWSDQGRRAAMAVWERIKGDYAWDQNLPENRGRNAKIPDGLTMRTLSVKRDFPHMWSNMVPSYPDLKTRLVFRPTWLRHTRFGEILYKADVLLKELSSGVSIVDPGMKLRAATVDGYVAPQMQSLVGTIFEQAGDTGYRGHRLWFDLMPQSGAHADPTPAALPALDPRVNRPLYSELAARGYISARVPTPVQKTALYASGDATDLSNVYPKMFVRRHDHATGKDISGTDAYLNAFSWDVNERTERYVAAYKELRNLTEVFRAYLASVSIIRHDAQVCRSLSVQALPLYDSEKTSVPLPEFHPSELFIYVVMHVTRQGNQRSLSLRSGNSISGGIALRGQEFYKESVAVRETPVIVELKQELAKGISDSTWRGRSGKRFVALAINSDGATTAEATRPRGLLDRDDATTADAKPRGLLDPDGATTADAKPRGLLDPDDATATAKARPRGLLD